MSRDKPTKPTAIQRRALAVVRAEMHLYDAMASTPRYRVEPPLRSDVVGPDLQSTRRCAHDVALVDVCTLCCRDEEDCKAYRRSAVTRLKDLLKMIGE